MSGTCVLTPLHRRELSMLRQRINSLPAHECLQEFVRPLHGVIECLAADPPDIRSAVCTCRLVAEGVVRRTKDACGSEMKHDLLLNLIEELYEAKVIPFTVRSALHQERVYGNDAIHWEDRAAYSADSAIMLLRQLINPVLTWYATDVLHLNEPSEVPLSVLSNLAVVESDPETILTGREEKIWRSLETNRIAYLVGPTFCGKSSQALALLNWAHDNCPGQACLRLRTGYDPLRDPAVTREILDDLESVAGTSPVVLWLDEDVRHGFSDAILLNLLPIAVESEARIAVVCSMRKATWDSHRHSLPQGECFDMDGWIPVADQGMGIEIISTLVTLQLVLISLAAGGKRAGHIGRTDIEHIGHNSDFRSTLERSVYWCLSQNERVAWNAIVAMTRRYRPPTLSILRKLLEIAIPEVPLPRLLMQLQQKVGTVLSSEVIPDEVYLPHDLFYEVGEPDEMLPYQLDDLQDVLYTENESLFQQLRREKHIGRVMKHLREIGENLLFLTALEHHDLEGFSSDLQEWQEKLSEQLNISRIRVYDKRLQEIRSLLIAMAREWLVIAQDHPIDYGILYRVYMLLGKMSQVQDDDYNTGLYYSYAAWAAYEQDKLAQSDCDLNDAAMLTVRHLLAAGEALQDKGDWRRVARSYETAGNWLMRVGNREEASGVAERLARYAEQIYPDLALQQLWAAAACSDDPDRAASLLEHAARVAVRTCEASGDSAYRHLALASLDRLVDQVGVDAPALRERLQADLGNRSIPQHADVLLMANQYDRYIADKVRAAFLSRRNLQCTISQGTEDFAAYRVVVFFGSLAAPDVGPLLSEIIGDEDCRIKDLNFTQAFLYERLRAPDGWVRTEELYAIAGSDLCGTIEAGNKFIAEVIPSLSLD